MSDYYEKESKKYPSFNLDKDVEINLNKHRNILIINNPVSGLLNEDEKEYNPGYMPLHFLDTDFMPYMINGTNRDSMNILTLNHVRNAALKRYIKMLKQAKKSYGAINADDYFSEGVPRIVLCIDNAGSMVNDIMVDIGQASLLKEILHLSAAAGVSVIATINNPTVEELSHEVFKSPLWSKVVMGTHSKEVIEEFLGMHMSKWANMSEDDLFIFDSSFSNIPLLSILIESTLCEGKTLGEIEATISAFFKHNPLL